MNECIHALRPGFYFIDTTLFSNIIPFAHKIAPMPIKMNRTFTKVNDLVEFQLAKYSRLFYFEI